MDKKKYWQSVFFAFLAGVTFLAVGIQRFWIAIGEESVSMSGYHILLGVLCLVIGIVNVVRGIRILRKRPEEEKE